MRPYSLEALSKEISDSVRWFEENNGSVLHPDWITTRVFNNHPDVSGDDADFYKVASWPTVRSAARKEINKYKVTEEDDRQIDLFPGYQRLQRRYVISREGEQVAVRLEEMTESEIGEKVEELRRMIGGLSTHVTELLRYLKERANAPLAAEG